MPSVLAQVNQTRSLVELGRFDEAIAGGAALLRCTKEDVGHPSSLVLASWMVPAGRTSAGASPTGGCRCWNGPSACARVELPTYAHWGAPALATAYAMTGRADEAVTLLEQRIETDLATNLLSQHTLTVVMLGEALLLAGREQAALARATEALELSRGRGERGFQAYALRLPRGDHQPPGSRQS